MSTTEKPILFSGPMIRAILAGDKTETRRVIRPQPPLDSTAPLLTDTQVTWMCWDHHRSFQHRSAAVRNPYGNPGDVLWVRETFALGGGYEGAPPSSAPVFAICWYRADGEPDQARGRWRPSIHMPRRFSRLRLGVLEVSVETLQAITRAEAIAEGAFPSADTWKHPSEPMWSFGAGLGWYDSPTAAFAAGWDTINGKRPGCAWADNPWCWKVKFEVGG